MINPMSMDGKTVIVTGAASGIGEATSKLLYDLGARVLLLDINGDELRSIVEEYGDRVFFREIDLTDFDRIKSVLTDAMSEIGSNFNGLVHCAGIPAVYPLRALSVEQFEKVMRINTESGLFLAKHFSSRNGHDASRQASIVFISSVYGVVGSAANVAYATSKAAVIGMTKSLAIELAGKGIRVNCVAPGFIRTNMASSVNKMFDSSYEETIENMHPLGWGGADDIANTIAFLLSDASKWTTGAVFNVDGGYTAQ